MRIGTLVVAFCLLLLPTAGLADTMDVSFVGGTVVGASNSLGTLGVTGSAMTSLTLNGVAVAGSGLLNISLGGFTPSHAGGTISTGNGVFGTGSLTLNCTDCDGYSGQVFTGNLGGFGWTLSDGGSDGTLNGSIIAAFSPGFASLLGTATAATIGDTITVKINTRTDGPGNLIVDFTPNPPSDPVPEPATLSLLGLGLLGLAGLPRQRREAL